MRINELQELLREKEYVIGLKQSKRNLEKQNAKMVIIAEDVEDRLKVEICGLCAKNNVSHLSAFTMAELGECCEIDVGASVVTILEREE